MISGKIYFIFKICLYFYVFKMTVAAILLSIYVKHTGDRSHNLITDGQSDNESQIYNLLFLIGCTNRGMRFAGVLGYGLYFAQTSTYFCIKYLHRKGREATEKTGLAVFIKNFNLEREQLSSRVDSQIRRVLASNSEYVERLRKAQIARTGRVLARRSMTGEMQMSCNSHHDPAKNLISLDDGQHDDCDYDDLRSPDEFSYTRRCLEELIRQHKFLKHLQRNQSPVFPVNRTREAGELMIKVHCFSSIIFMIVFCVTGSYGTFLALYMAHSAIESDETLSPDMRSFNLMERFDIIWQQLFIWRISEWYAKAVSFMVCGFVDQTKNFTHLKKLMLDLNRKFLLMNENQNHSQSPSTTEGRHLSKYDPEALRLYIKFQIYTNEARLMFKRLEYCVLFVYGGLGFTVILAVSIDGQITNSKLFNYLSIFCVLTLNLILYPCALLTEHCMKVTKLGWSLVANSELSGQPEMGDACRPSDSRRRSPSSMIHRPLQIKIPRHRQRPISAHTSKLWRRVIEDSESLFDLLSCNLFGLVHLNFASVIQFNLYLASVILLLLNNHQ